MNIEECEKLKSINRDLLEALKGMLKLYAHIVETGTDWFWKPHEAHEVLKAKAAIKLATE